MVAILTSGTLADPDMLRAQPEAAYVLSLWERPALPLAPGGPPRTLLGACYTDCASNTLTLGQWCVLRQPRIGILRLRSSGCSGTSAGSMGVDVVDSGLPCTLKI